MSEIEGIIVGLRAALCEAESKLREAKVIPMPPPKRGWTNADEARSWVRNALVYAQGNGSEEYKVRTLVANLERIGKLLEDPNAQNHEGPHQ